MVSSGWWPAAGSAEPAGRPRRRAAVVPGWLFVLALALVVGTVGVLGFVSPGYFVATVLDHESVQDGVRTILRDDYRLTGIAEVTCPPDQKVLAAHSFSCDVVIDGRHAEVPVTVQDQDGHYRVGRPS